MSYMHLFAFIFKISKAGNSFCCVSTGVSYFFKSSKRYSLELLSSKSPCLLQTIDGGDLIMHRPLKRIHRIIIQTKHEIRRNHDLKMDQVSL